MNNGREPNQHSFYVEGVDIDCYDDDSAEVHGNKIDDRVDNLNHQAEQPVLVNLQERPRWACFLWINLSPEI